MMKRIFEQMGTLLNFALRNANGMTQHKEVKTFISVHNIGVMLTCQQLERWIVRTPSSVNVFVTLATQQHLEYNCKTLFETPCITNESHIEP
jgi:hypothetical protein